MDLAGAVMVSHAAGPGGVPASLSEKIATGLLRSRLGFEGAAFSDDLEMGALAAFGSIAERCAAACRAGCDLLFVCSRFSDYPACVEEVARRVLAARIEGAIGRLDGYARHLEVIRAAAKVSERPVSALIADIAELRNQSIQNGTSSS